MSNAPTLERLNPKPRPIWWQAFQQIHQQLVNVLNHNVEFGNPTSGALNIKGQWGNVAGNTTITTPAANTDFTVTHNLGQPAVGVDVKSKSAAVDVYTSPTVNANPDTTIILRATTAGTKITLFIH